MSNIKDYFEFHEETPLCVQNLINKFGDGKCSYAKCNKLINKLRKLGWSADYGLDAIPYNLRPITRHPNVKSKKTLNSTKCISEVE
jgi:hypothetical protein